MRVCEYKVLGNHNGEYLPSTTFEEPKSVFSANNVCIVEEDTAEEDVDPFDDEIDHDLEDEFAEEDVQVESPFVVTPPQLTPSLEPMKGTAKKKKHKAKKKKGKALVMEFDRLKALDTLGLLNETMDTLRVYASTGLRVVGASKMSGGKTALVAAIVKARS
jgi:hypothetical protein